METVNEILGVKVEEIEKERKPYYKKMGIILITDIVMIVLVTLYMFSRAGGGVETLVIVEILSIVAYITYAVVSERSRSVLLYYSERLKKSKVEEETYNVTEEDVKTMLYCVGKKKKKLEKLGMEQLEEELLDVLKKDKQGNKKIYKMLRKTKEAKEESKELTIKKIKVRGATFIIGLD